MLTVKLKRYRQDHRSQADYLTMCRRRQRLIPGTNM